MITLFERYVNSSNNLPTYHLLRRNRQRIRKIPLKSLISEGFWSEWGDSNARSLEPKSSAIPTSLHPDIQFLPLYHGERENQRFFCLWSFLWSKTLLCRFRQSGEIPQTQASQGFAALRHAPSRIPPRHTQIKRDTNFATPGYSISAMIPWRAVKIKFFLSVVIYVVKAAFAPLSATGEKPAIARAARLCGISPYPVPDAATALPNQARYQLRYTRILLILE